MDWLQIVLIVLAAAGVWAVIELALTLRRARGTVESLDKSVEEVNEVVNEARPVIAKLDGALDELSPALAQVEPLLKQAGVAIEALSADLIEVNGVLRDVSQVTGTVSSASDAVSGLADAASEKVQQLLGRGRGASSEHALEQGSVPEPTPSGSEDTSSSEPTGSRYYTYSTESEENDEL
ncbi:MAG: hypothetical protein SOU51_06875 [Collinsella sp.]|nr:hypothetical protein [Collinsella sp.]